ncbi:MAG: hypothetical protein GF411_06475 [Candidatus Lokiarchaeota archaeon]|nr:hypothetical protein [Candidatus Lokiarchaeota archaeon]
MEKSFVILKPDGTCRRTVSAIVLKALIDMGYSVKAFQEIQVSKALAEQHYGVHKEKPFFPWLVQFITASPVLAIIFEGPNVIQGIRNALGATFVQKASDESLRGRYGIWAGINLAHASDGIETATQETDLWTGQSDLAISEDAKERASQYVDRYIGGAIDYTMEIRNVVRGAIKAHDTSDDVMKQLIDLLGKDASGIDQKSIQNLAEAIFAFIEEEVEKSD